MKLFTLLFLIPLSVAATETSVDIPQDVLMFVEQRDSCDHFLNEPPYNEERREFLSQKITELCVGIGEQFQSLKMKYKENSAVINFLEKYDVNIEQ